MMGDFNCIAKRDKILMFVFLVDIFLSVYSPLIFLYVLMLMMADFNPVKVEAQILADS